MKLILIKLITVCILVLACNTKTDEFFTSTFIIQNNISDSINVSFEVIDSAKKSFSIIGPNKSYEIYKTSYFLMIPEPTNTFKSIHISIHNMDTVLLNEDTIKNEIWKKEKIDENTWKYYLEIKRLKSGL